MYKVALDAGHGLYTAGKRCLASLDGNQTREWTLNSRICDKIQSMLQAYDGYEIMRVDDVTGQTDVSLSSRTTKANNWGANIYLSVHHNAGISGGSGGGIEVYVYTKVDTGTLAAQTDLYNCLIKHTGLKGNRSAPIKKANFAVLRQTSMTAVLAECGFMDSSTDVPIILTDTFANQVANAYVEFIVAYGHLTKKYVAPIEPVIAAPVEVKQIYRIRLSWSDAKSQVAAFSNLGNAVKTVNEGEFTGYKVFDNDGNIVYESFIAAPTQDIVVEPVITESIKENIVEIITEPTPQAEIPPTNDFVEPPKEVVEQKESVLETIVEDEQTETVVITPKNFFSAIIELIKIILNAIKKS